MKKKSGFTLIELMVALVIFAIGLLAIGSISIYVIKGNKSSSFFTQALTLAQDRIEQMKNRQYSSITPLNFSDEDYGNVRNQDQDYLLFRREVSISETSGRKQVTVTVRWDNNAHSVQVSTLFIQ